MLIHNTKPIILNNNLSIFCDIGKEFELKADLLKIITNKNYDVEVANLCNKKLLYEVSKEMHFDMKATGNQSIRDRTLLKMLKSPGILVSASGVSLSHKTIFLSSDFNELCERIKIMLQEKQAGENSEIKKLKNLLQ